MESHEWLNEWGAFAPHSLIPRDDAPNPVQSEVIGVADVAVLILGMSKAQFVMPEYRWRWHFNDWR